MSRARHWTWTLNNWTPQQVQSLEAKGADLPTYGISYLVFGKETAPSTGTPHLQGFVSLPSPVSAQRVKSILGFSTVHIERAHHPKEAAEYCKKDGDFKEFGEPAFGSQGKRKDLDLFLETVRSGERDYKKLLELHPSVLARYPQFVDRCLQEFRPKVPCPDLVLRPWQVLVKGLLEGEPDPRKIIFCVDPPGGAGKTTFARWVCSKFENTLYLRPGKQQDMAFLVPEDLKILVVDVPCGSAEHLQYPFLESVKDGLVTSYKYQPVSKVLLAVPHVLVLMNHQPDQSQLSSDRFFIVDCQ